MNARALLTSAENPCIGGLQWVSDPLFLGRSNALAMKYAYKGLFEPFDGLPRLTYCFSEKTALWAILGPFLGCFYLLTEFIGDYPGFWATPAPCSVVGFGADRRAYAGLIKGAVRGCDAFYLGWGKGLDSSE